MKKLNYSQEILIYPFSVIPIFVWLGFVCSISFMEAWLKFRAPNVSLAVGLSIGKLIFAALNKMEWMLAGITAIGLFFNHPRRMLTKSIFFYIPIAILILQTFSLLPSLNERADNIIQGSKVFPSSVHFYYIFFEVIKVISLFILGINIIWICNKTEIGEH